MVELLKRFLNDSGVEYDYVDVDLLDRDEQQAVQGEIRRWNPSGSFPTLVIDDEKSVAGYNEERITEALGL